MAFKGVIIFMKELDVIWSYSKYYADILSSAVRLSQIGKYRSSLIILLNAFELVVKSVREDDRKNLIDDIKWLKENCYIDEEEESFLNDEANGIRKIRNLMMHRDLYMYVVEVNDVAYFFADEGTWKMLYDMVAMKLIAMLVNIVERKQFS